VEWVERWHGGGGGVDEDDDGRYAAASSAVRASISRRGDVEVRVDVAKSRGTGRAWPDVRGKQPERFREEVKKKRRGRVSLFFQRE
jgi:hypothetical protein